jgi:hypothetical protein
LANIQGKKREMEQRAIAHFFTLKGLKAKEIEMELTSVYGDGAVQISAAKKWRTFPAEENMARRWPTIEKARQF